jgi:nucleolar protein 16
MGREIQKKKRRSKSQPIRQSNRLKKPVNPLGNNTIAANWFVFFYQTHSMDRGATSHDEKTLKC